MSEEQAIPIAVDLLEDEESAPVPKESDLAAKEPTLA
jgi:hypothetical protein